MTFLALIAIIFFGFAVYNLTCAFVDIPTKKTSQMMMLSRKQQGTKNEKLLDVYGVGRYDPFHAIVCCSQHI